MTRISVDYYNFNKHQFPQVASALRKHLSVNEKNHKPHWVSESELLEPVKKNIPDTPKPYQNVTFKLSWNEARILAYDMGLTDVDWQNESEESYRYDMPLSSGTARTHKVEIFGKEVTDCGDHPFQVRVAGDINYGICPLNLLQSWKQEFKKNTDEFLDKVIEVGKDTQGFSSQGTKFLSSLPRTVEEFDDAIKESAKQNDLLMVQCAINMVRFYQDFIGTPLEEVLGPPNSVEFLGWYDFNLSLSPEDVKIACERPTKPLQEVVENIFSKKQRDDVQLTQVMK